MPDFNEIDWREYKVKLRASDNTRRTLNRLAQGDNLMYFQSTDIYLDVRLFLNRKEKKIEDLKDVIKYKWSLCTEDGKPVQIDQSRLLNFCFPNGSGVADLKLQQNLQHLTGLRLESYFGIRSEVKHSFVKFKLYT